MYTCNVLEMDKNYLRKVPCFKQVVQGDKVNYLNHLLVYTRIISYLVIVIFILTVLSQANSFILNMPYSQFTYRIHSSWFPVKGIRRHHLSLESSRGNSVPYTGVRHMLR